MKAHLLKQTGKGISICKKVGHDEIYEMRKMENEVANRILVSQPKRVPLATTSISSSLTLTDQSISNALKRKKIDNSSIGKALNIQTRARLYTEIARMFYTGGLPFNLAKNPYYVSSYSFATNHALDGYMSPSCNGLRITLL